MKVSDYVVHLLEEAGVTDVFLLAGGGLMHLLDSVSRSKRITSYYNLNEQASSFCADSYAQASNRLGVCMVTTGPGATNAITGAASAFIDSSPVLVISGQVRTNAMIGETGARQIGAQEVSIVPMVRPVTKYAKTILKAEDVRYHIEKGIYLATHGRKGTVWIDIPLDIQAQQVDPDRLKGFDPEAEKVAVYVSEDALQSTVVELENLLMKSQRPVILAGSGIFFAGAEKEFAQLASRLGVPVLCTNKFSRIASRLDKSLFFGAPGANAPRYSNYILQNSDLLIILGCGLRYYITAFDESHFAPWAKKANVNIDAAEMTKLSMTFDVSLVCDAKKFIKKSLDEMALIHLDHISQWKSYCIDIKARYPVLQEALRVGGQDLTSWVVYSSLKQQLHDDDVIATVSASYCILPFYLDFEATGCQQVVQTVGLGSMGHGVPCAIAVCIASGKKRTIMFEGDGSLQHNIQELALIRQYELPIKLFIENNGGYSSIYKMQQNHFKGHLAGCSPESGVLFPSLEKIASAYGIEYVSIRTTGEVKNKMKYILDNSRAMICELFTSIDFPDLLSTKSRVLENGQMATSKLEDLYPFLSEEEHIKNMIGQQSD